MLSLLKFCIVYPQIMLGFKWPVSLYFCEKCRKKWKCHCGTFMVANKFCGLSFNNCSAKPLVHFFFLHLGLKWAMLTWKSATNFFPSINSHNSIFMSCTDAMANWWVVLIWTLLSHSHPRRILGVDFTFAWSQEQEQEWPPPKFS